MDEHDTYELVKLRNNKVVKANTLIQQSRHHLSVQQQKVLLFIISHLKPDQKEFEWQTFDIAEFCRVCGIVAAGDNYKDLKNAILGLKNKGFWITVDDDDITVSWVAKAKITPKQGQIKIMLDNDMKPFLLELKARFTAFDLKYTLAMRSKYSVRLYELLKSYANQHSIVTFDLPRFKVLIGADYELWYDIKRFVLETATSEINEVSDINVSWRGLKKGRSFVGIEFIISLKKDYESQVATERAVYKRLLGRKEKETKPQVEGQISFDGSEVEQ